MAAQTTADRADVRELRRDALVSAQESAERDRLPVDFRLILGMAYTDTESGERRLATPFQWRARFNERKSYIKFSGDGLRGWVGVTLPSGGEVGSSDGRTRVGASYEHVLYGPWSAQIEGQLVRFLSDPEPGESALRRQLLGQIVYSFDSNTLVLGQLERAYRPGVATLSRGLSDRAHDTTIELDIGLRF